MSVFAVIGDDSVVPERLEKAVTEAFADANFRFTTRVFFVSGKGLTSKQASEAIGVAKGGFTGVAVVRLSGSYWGVANPELWAWLKASIEQDDG